MKNLLAIILCVPLCALAQVPPPAPASVQDVIDGTATYKFVSPASLSGAGITGGGGGGIAVSNVANLTFATNTRITNDTLYYAQFDSVFALSGSANNTAILHINVDTNADGTYDYTKPYSQLAVSSTLSITNQFNVTLPPQGVVYFSNVINVVSTPFNSIVYYSTNSGGGGGAGNVTQSGLAAGSYAVKPTALTGILNWTSTNTVNVGSSNAITVVSNVSYYASFILTNAVGAGIAGTYYYHSPGVLTNNAGDGAVFWTGSEVDPTYTAGVFITNSTHPDINVSIAGFIPEQSEFPSITYSNGVDEILDGDSNPFSPAVYITGVTLGLSPLHAKVNADLSGSFNIPTPSGVITNNWQSSAGQINLTNAIRPTSINMGYDYGISLNYRAGAGDNTNYVIITNGAINLSGAGNNGIYGTGSGILWPQGYISYNDGWVLMRSAKFSMEHTADFSHVRFGDDHRQDQLVKLALSGTGETHGLTNQYSAMLGFHSVAASGLQGMSGIQGRHEDGNATTVYSIGGVNYTESETWFFSLIPEPKAHTNGGWGTNDLGRAYMVGRKDGAYFNKAVLATNGISSFSTVAAASITATGWTNIWSTNNATVYVERGASVSVTLKNRANATLNTFTAGTTPLTIALQPGWGFSASGNLSGNAVPF